MLIRKNLVRRALKSLVTSVAALSSVSVMASPPVASFAQAHLGSNGQIEMKTFGSDRPGAVYQAGSIGKFACTLAALRMVDREELNLDVPIVRLLPEYKTQARSITLRHLLANRSGLSDGLMPAFRKDPTIPSSSISALQAANLYASKGNGSEAGSTFSYDLVNWIVVQAVLEKVSGTPIDELLKREVLEPASMQSSFIFSGVLDERGQQPESPTMEFPAFLGCAGGLATTPADLLALLRFPHKGGLSTHALSNLTTVTTPEEAYTLGGRYSRHEDAVWSWQSGSNGPYKSVAIYDPSRDIGYAAMNVTNDKQLLEEHRDLWLASHKADAP